MPTAAIVCPRCSKRLRIAKPFGVGSRFRCPRCHAGFAARPEDVPAPTEDAPPPRPGGWLPLLVVVGVALLLLVGSGVALAVFLAVRGAARPPVLAGAGRPDDIDSPITPDHGPPERPPFIPAADPEPPAQAWLPPDKLDEVNRAIDRGVEYLKKTQKPEGTWSPGGWQVGLTGLPGLTLLECGAPPDDPHVRAAADYVRKNAPRNNSTYELALSILFLDRLGDPQDESLIRTLALRLIAGQTAAGGWTYGCPVLSEKEQESLLTVLQTTRPLSALDLVASQPGDNRPADLFIGRPAETAVPPVVGSTIPLPPRPTEDDLKQARLLYNGLSPALRAMPALKPPTGEDQMPAGDQSDNSNTQFATLGLWAAGRHGVPMARSLSLLARRFQVSQDFRGGWTYNYYKTPNASEEPAPAMTGAGLLGLAVGHGVTADLKGADVEAARADPRVERGMKALGQYIPNGHGAPSALERNYYFLWSVERVGMLYNRKAIADKEWYPWGAADLVALQGADGDWKNGSYPGATPTSDTCFALLFLKRANLAKDLTGKVQFLNQIK